MSVKPLRLRRLGKRVGAVVLGLVALDLIATIATLAIGASWLER